MALAKTSKTTATPSKPRAASLLEFAEGGGLFDDMDVTIEDAAFTIWDYNGSGPETFALAIQYKDGEGNTYDQYYSAGSTDFWKPSDDGAFAVPIADKTALQTSTNAVQFLQSLITAGLPRETLADMNVKNLIGLKLHVKRQAQPTRDGLAPRTGKNADRQATVLLATSILKGSKGAATATTSKTNGTTDDLETTAASALVEIIMEQGGSVSKKELPKLAMNKLKNTPGWQKVSQLLFKDEFLKGVEGVTYEGGTLSIEG